MQLVKLQERADDIAGTGTRLIGISYDSAETLGKFAESSAISFPLLSDEESSVIDEYEMRNDKAKGRQEGIPHPTTFLIDQDKKIRARLDGSVMRRHTPDQLLAEIAKLSGDQ